MLSNNDINPNFNSIRQALIIKYRHKRQTFNISRINQSNQEGSLELQFRVSLCGSDAPNCVQFVYLSVRHISPVHETVLSFNCDTHCFK